MTAAAASGTRSGGRVPPLVLLAIAGAWALAVVAEVTGTSHALHEVSSLRGARLWATLVLFLVAWQAMTAAMMLPSSLPLIRLFDAASRGQDRPACARAAFLGGYALVWTAFGAVAFLGDVGLHRLLDPLVRPWVVAGGVLTLAGLFQFSDLKDKCLSKCRAPGPYLVSHYRRGAAGGFRLGAGHGLFCLGCCWALMLVMFAAGVAMLWWMAALTAVMVYEKTGRRGRELTPWVGVALLVLAAVAFAHLPWIGLFE